MHNVADRIVSEEADFTPEIDCEIIRGYLDGRDAMIVRLERQHGLSQSAVLKRAAILGLNRQVVEQLSLSELTYGPRSCLACEKIFLSRGPGNRLCTRCIKRG